VQALVATILWSSSALQIDQLTGKYHLSPLQISTWRVVMVLPILIVVIAIRRPSAFRLALSDLPLLIAAGLVGIMLSYVVWAQSVKLNGPAVAAALSYSAPAIVAIGERALFGARLQRLQVVAIVFTLIGCALASGINSPAALIHSPLGVVVGLAVGGAFASYTLLNHAMRRIGSRDPFTLLLAVFAVGAVGLLTWGWLTQGARLVHLDLSTTGWALLLGVALGPTLLSYALYNNSLRSLPATFAILITTLEPPLVAIGSLVILGKTITVQQWAGMIVIVASVIAMQFSVMHSRKT
jgi:drug/metabolite transporter (DMT)-like permease